MELLEKHLFLQPSTIPGAGMGLFTSVFIAKGSYIAEYKGVVRTWKAAHKLDESRFGYLLYINSRCVIDAWQSKDGVAQYANDARGIVKVQGLKNNSIFTTEGTRCFLEAAANIPAGAEILVSYGAEYWKVIRANEKIDRAALSRQPERQT